MSTLKDVARLANVDVSTVSRALSGKGYIHPTTREKIMEAVAQLSYRPNVLLKGVREGKRRTICVIVPTLTLSIFSEITQGIEQTARDSDYEVVIVHTKDDAAFEAKCLHRLRENYTDGIIIASTGKNQRLIRDIHASGTPVVQIVRRQTPDLSSVTADFYACGYRGARYMIKKGCRHIALISGPRGIAPYRDRYRGYRKAIQEMDLEEYVLPYTTLPTSFFQSGYDGAIQLLDRFPHLDSLLLATDLQALGAMRALKDKRVSVPDRIKVMSLTGHSIGGLLETGITSMEMPSMEMGKSAAQMLLRLIRSSSSDAPVSVEHISFETTLVVRETT